MEFPNSPRCERIFALDIIYTLPPSRHFPQLLLIKYFPSMKIIIYLVCLLLAQSLQGQNNNNGDTFTIITAEIKEYKLNIKSPPDDKKTASIRHLRSLRGGFNIQEAINFKLG